MSFVGLKKINRAAPPFFCSDAKVVGSPGRRFYSTCTTARLIEAENGMSGSGYSDNSHSGDGHAAAISLSRSKKEEVG
jgi:hypothetical protein